MKSYAGNDTIRSYGGHDTILGGKASDYITAGGFSSVHAGIAGDTIKAGFHTTAQDTILAGNGGDQITIKQGHNFVRGASNDTIRAGIGYKGQGDTIYGGKGPETIYSGQYSKVIGGGNDTITTGNHDTITLTGHDVLMGDTTTGASAHSSTVLLNATSGKIQGGPGHIDATLGNMHTFNDTVFGGSGGLTLHVSQLHASSEMHQSDGSTVVKFGNGQQLDVQHVTIIFGTGPHSHTETFS